MSTPAVDSDSDDEGGAVMSGLLFRDLGFTSLETAIDHLRAFAVAHSDLEPTLRCERARDGRRRWALDVYLRANPRRST
jgi:hypothetical protein